ncbi:MAG TPA: hypothetical protein V6C97_06210, partial [Oculatellaceae cyanobacterium]
TAWPGDDVRAVDRQRELTLSRVKAIQKTDTARQTTQTFGSAETNKTEGCICQGRLRFKKP